MPEIVRVREARYRDQVDNGDYSSDDERSSHGRSRGYKTVQRYRVATPGRVEEVEEDRRLVRSDRLDIGGRNDRLEVDRRVERVDRIERPRSALERYGEPERSHETSRTIVYERDRERQRDRSPESTRPWERERDKTWERDVDVRVERRHHDDEPVELERYQRETEYYSRPEPQPIVIRQRAPEAQKIIVETAPPPPLIIPQERHGYEVVRRQESIENREVVPRTEEDYYYRRDVRDVNPRREEVVYNRRERHRGPSDDEYSEGEVIIRKEKKVIRPRSHSPYHKLHLAEGALAGAGAAALIANHRDSVGSGPEHRGRKIAGGAALGAIGAEIITRARSHYRDKENRSRSSSRHNHTKLKTGLALAATALAAAAAGKYISNRNEKKEEMDRGRSRTRSISRRRASTGDHDSDRNGRSKSRHADPKHRAATMAKAGVVAAAATAVAKRLRSKSRGRSKSKIRSGAEIAAAGLAGAAAAGLYENRKAKQDATDEAAKEARSRTRSRRRSRSAAYSDPGNDRELDMVEYGAAPVYSRTRDSRGFYDPAAADGGAAYGRSRSRNRDNSPSRSRSRSRMQDMASGALGGAAAASSFNRYQRGSDRNRRRKGPQSQSP